MAHHLTESVENVDLEELREKYEQERQRRVPLSVRLR